MNARTAREGTYLAGLLFLSQGDVRRLVSMKEAMAAAAAAFRAYSEGHAKAPVRLGMDVPAAAGGGAGVSLFMPGYVAGSFAALGAKIVSVFPGNQRRGLPTITALVILLDPETGQPIAAVEGSYLTALRTGAASAVATWHLARTDATRLAVLGAGAQSRTQALGVAVARPVTDVAVFDADAAKAPRFIADAGEAFAREGLPLPRFTRAASAEEAVRGADIICTATTSSNPVFDHAWLAPGAHVNAIGGFKPEMREIPAETIAACDLLVVDSRAAVWAEAGELIQPLEQGLISRDKVHAELGEVVAGARPGRTGDGQLTVFKTVGMAVLDMAVGALAYRKAIQAGAGTQVDLGV